MNEEEQLATNIYIDLINIIDDESLIELIKEDHHIISNVKKVSKTVFDFFVKTYGEHSMGVIKNIPDSFLEQVLQENGEAIMFLKNDPSIKLQKIAVKNHCGAIFYIKSPSESVIIESIKYIDFDMYNEEEFLTHYYPLISTPKIFWNLFNKFAHDENSLNSLKNHKYYKDDAHLIIRILNQN